MAQKAVVCAYKKKFRQVNEFNINPNQIIAEHRRHAEQLTRLKRKASEHIFFRLTSLVREGTGHQILLEFQTPNRVNFRRDINSVRITERNARSEPNAEFVEGSRVYQIHPEGNIVAQSIEPIITEFEVNFANSFIGECYGRVKRLLKCFARIHLENMEDDQIKIEIRNTMRYLFNDINDITEPNRTLIRLYRQELRPICRGQVPRGWWNNKSTWYSRVPDLINGLYYLKAYNDGQRIGRDCFKLFTVIPRFKSHFVHKTKIDTRLLCLTMNKFLPEGQKLDSQNIDYTVWNRVFDMTPLERTHTDRKLVFNYSITTDAVSMSATMIQGTDREIEAKRELRGRGAKLAERKRLADERKMEESTKATKRKAGKDADEPPAKRRNAPVPTRERDLLQKLKSGEVFGTVIQIDPGVKNTLGCVAIDMQNGHERNLLITSKYYHHLLQTHLRKERKRPIIAHLHAMIRGVHASYANPPTRKGGDIREYLDSVFRLFDMFTEVYQRRVFSRMRFDAHICKQKAVDKISKQIASLNPHQESATLIMFGNSQMSRKSPIKGYVKSPHKNYWVKQFDELERVEVYEVDEYRTTKTCSFCGQILHVTRNIGHRYVSCKDCYPAGNASMVNEPKEVQTKSKQYWRRHHYRVNGIRTFSYSWEERMSHRKCRTTNRDINAPRNIGLKGFATITGRENLLPVALIRANDND